MFKTIHGQPMAEVPSAVRQAGPFLVREPVMRVPRWWLVLKYVVLSIMRAARWCVRHPVTCVATALAGYIWASLGRDALLWTISSITVAGTVWFYAHRRSFMFAVGFPAIGGWRRLVGYRRHWHATMSVLGLAVVFQNTEYLPALRRVSCTNWCDRVRVDMVSGQTPEQWQKCANALAHTFGALACKVTSPKPRRIVLEFTRIDPLTHTVTPNPHIPGPDSGAAMPVDLGALPLGVREDGAPWLLRLAGTHVLIAGASGAGKGSILWSLLDALGPAIRSGHVAPWVIDPKGGMELSPGEAMFARFACTDYAAMADLLELAVDRMDERTARLRGVARQHTPTPADPLILILIDELANLTAYLPDNNLRKRIGYALALLLSKGRAVGVHVVAAVQDPRKDIVAMRDLFPTRIALRLTEDNHVDMVLGDGARDRGAYCDHIPETSPGVGYVVLDGHRDPVRVRAAHHTDTDIRAMAPRFRSPHRPADVDSGPLHTVPMAREGAA